MDIFAYCIKIFAYKNTALLLVFAALCRFVAAPCGNNLKKTLFFAQKNCFFGSKKGFFSNYSAMGQK